MNNSFLKKANSYNNMEKLSSAMKQIKDYNILVKDINNDSNENSLKNILNSSINDINEFGKLELDEDVSYSGKNKDGTSDIENLKYSNNGYFYKEIDGVDYGTTTPSGGGTNTGDGSGSNDNSMLNPDNEEFPTLSKDTNNYKYYKYENGNFYIVETPDYLKGKFIGGNYFYMDNSELYNIESDPINISNYDSASENKLKENIKTDDDGEYEYYYEIEYEGTIYKSVIEEETIVFKNTIDTGIIVINKKEENGKEASHSGSILYMIIDAENSEMTELNENVVLKYKKNNEVTELNKWSLIYNFKDENLYFYEKIEPTNIGSSVTIRSEISEEEVDIIYDNDNINFKEIIIKKSKDLIGNPLEINKPITVSSLVGKPLELNNESGNKIIYMNDDKNPADPKPYQYFSFEDVPKLIVNGYDYKYDKKNKGYFNENKSEVMNIIKNTLDNISFNSSYSAYGNLYEFLMNHSGVPLYESEVQPNEFNRL